MHVSERDYKPHLSRALCRAPLRWPLLGKKTYFSAFLRAGLGSHGPTAASFNNTGKAALRARRGNLKNLSVALGFFAEEKSRALCFHLCNPLGLHKHLRAGTTAQFVPFQAFHAPRSRCCQSTRTLFPNLPWRKVQPLPIIPELLLTQVC